MFESDTPVKNSRSHMLNSGSQSRIESERTWFTYCRHEGTSTREVPTPFEEPFLIQQEVVSHQI